MEVLRKHYSDLYNNVDNNNDIQFVLKTCSFNRMYLMSAINLPDNFVSFLEPETSDRFMKCTALYLPNNLLHGWNDLFNILEIFPNLITLDIS
jgi:hypothetical protein